MEVNGKRPAEDDPGAAAPRKRRSRFSEAPPVDTAAAMAAAKAAAAAQLQAQIAAQMQNFKPSQPATTDDTAAKAAQRKLLEAQIASATATLALPVQPGAAVTAQAQPKLTKRAKDYTLRLDAQGREIDAEGNLIRTMRQSTATAKANVDAHRRANNPYLAHRSKELDPSDPSYIDPREAARAAAARPKRAGFSFVTEGTYVKQAEKERERELVKEHRQLLRGHLKSSSSAAEGGEAPTAMAVAKAAEAAAASAKSAAKDGKVLAASAKLKSDFPPPRDHGQAVPAVEWWDEAFLPEDSNDSSTTASNTAAAAAGVGATTAGADSSTMDVTDSSAAAASNADSNYSSRSKYMVTLPQQQEPLQGPYVRARLDACRTYKYIQHPPALPGAAESSAPGSSAVAPVAPTVHLTKAERKRVRRHARSEREREKQDKMALGLLPPPPVKMKISNFMRVLGEQAVADPSKVERMVQQQVQARRLNHEMRNQARKKTPEEKRLKKKDKLAKDMAKGLVTAVFRVDDMSHPKCRYKVDVNAQQLALTGCVMMCAPASHATPAAAAAAAAAAAEPGAPNPALGTGINVLVAEGGPKAIRKFSKLLLHRIRWQGDDFDGDDDESSSDEEEDPAEHGDDNGGKSIYSGGLASVNPSKAGTGCRLVWQGVVVKRAFAAFRLQQCSTAELGREAFEAKGIAHYWDMAAK